MVFALLHIAFDPAFWNVLLSVWEIFVKMRHKLV
jgi:hypothetical protein